MQAAVPMYLGRLNITPGQTDRLFFRSLWEMLGGRPALIRQIHLHTRLDVTKTSGNIAAEDLGEALHGVQLVDNVEASRWRQNLSGADLAKFYRQSQGRWPLYWDDADISATGTKDITITIPFSSNKLVNPDDTAEPASLYSEGYILFDWAQSTVFSGYTLNGSGNSYVDVVVELVAPRGKPQFGGRLMFAKETFDKFDDQLIRLQGKNLGFGLARTDKATAIPTNDFSKVRVEAGGQQLINHQDPAYVVRAINENLDPDQVYSWSSDFGRFLPLTEAMDKSTMGDLANYGDITLRVEEGAGNPSESEYKVLQTTIARINAANLANAAVKSNSYRGVDPGEFARGMRAAAAEAKSLDGAKPLSRIPSGVRDFVPRVPTVPGARR